MVNDQIEFNLNHRSQDTLDLCITNNVSVTAYSPLERGTPAQESLLAEMARKYATTRAQVLVRWLMQKGMIVIPRSSNADHIKSNFLALEWTMEEGDVSKIDELK